MSAYFPHDTKSETVGKAGQPYKAKKLEVPISYPSDSVYAAVEGPTVSVNTPAKPQSLLSVPGTHSMA